MDFSEIRNHYERLVSEYLRDNVIPTMPDKDENFFLDIACIALNRLPPRYIRNAVDMSFYLQDDERDKLQEQVKDAVEEATRYIEKNYNSNGRYDFSSQ